MDTKLTYYKMRLEEYKEYISKVLNEELQLIDEVLQSNDVEKMRTFCSLPLKISVS